ncbi:hypothetical protein [uncultured Erythrobacter sp.]|uniref:hypothetical protein n=1 Tax=uncultured Erythrobacter sp. TaxID=263913 RepID=UPI00261C6DD5|nr:hypothetical protein [uncultured Erythrobacter sp.]
MYLRIFSSLLVIGALTACEATQSPEPQGTTLDCAIGSGAEFDAVCTLEWIDEEWGQEFLIHHPGGGFRRFLIKEDVSGVIVKDGAEDVEMVDPSPKGLWQFSVNGDRYLMPTPPPSQV